MNWKNAFLPATILVLILMAFLINSCSQDNNDDNDDDDDDSSPVCQPTCWQNSPERATGSLTQVEEWASACEQADSGCAEEKCLATYLEFYDAPEPIRYAVQCESGPVNDFYDQCIGSEGVVNYYWLGPLYGFLSEENCGGCGQPDNRVPTGWDYAANPTEGMPLVWDEEKVTDVLAHEVSAVSCKQIADYRQCVRAFLPPYTHCVPYLNEVTGEFIECYSADEPYNRDPDWRKVVAECMENE